MKKDFANYLAIGKLMAVEWAQLQGSDFEFSGMDLNNLEDFYRAVEKVTADLKMLKEISAEVQIFNSFLKDIHLPAISTELKDHVETSLSANNLHVVPNLSKRIMKEYLVLDFEIELLLPQGSFADFSQSGSVTGKQTKNFAGDKTISIPSSLSPKAQEIL